MVHRVEMMQHLYKSLSLYAKVSIELCSIQYHNIQCLYIGRHLSCFKCTLIEKSIFSALSPLRMAGACVMSKFCYSLQLVIDIMWNVPLYDSWLCKRKLNRFIIKILTMLRQSHDLLVVTRMWPSMCFKSSEWVNLTSNFHYVWFGIDGHENLSDDDNRLENNIQQYFTWFDFVDCL